MRKAFDMVSRPAAVGDGADARPWRARIEARLDRVPSELNLGQTLKPAAILLPIIEREEPSVLLTKRSDNMPTHAGQISFPGGRVHAGSLSRGLEEGLQVEVCRRRHSRGTVSRT